MPDGFSRRSNAFVIFDNLPNSILIVRLYQRRPIDLEIGIEQSGVGISADAPLLPGAILRAKKPTGLGEPRPGGDVLNDFRDVQEPGVPGISCSNRPLRAEHDHLPIGG